MYQQEKRNVYRIWFLIFVAGFLLGILIMNFGSSRFMQNGELFDMTAMYRMKYFEVDSESFLKYELPQRLRDFLLLLVISTTCFGIVAAYLWIAWQGILAGMVITAAIIKFGIKGILLILAGIFPQHLLFIPAAVMMLCWSCQTCCLLYFPEKSIFLPFQNKKRQYLHQLGMILWIICVVVIGCILECYVNPILLSDIIKFF
ncbi:MAG: stage II sporulation protein M [Suilimivivens sp.]